MSYARKSVYLCRFPRCKHRNVVWERVDADDNVIETAPAWKCECGNCGRGSLDLIYQDVIKPETTLEDSASAPGDKRRPKAFRPIFKE